MKAGMGRGGLRLDAATMHLACMKAGVGWGGLRFDRILPTSRRERRRVDWVMADWIFTSRPVRSFTPAPKWHRPRVARLPPPSHSRPPRARNPGPTTPAHAIYPPAHAIYPPTPSPDPPLRPLPTSRPLGMLSFPLPPHAPSRHSPWYRSPSAYHSVPCPLILPSTHSPSYLHRGRVAVEE